MSNPRAGGSPARVLVALLIAALNLRLCLAIVGPLIEEIRADLHMSSALAGLLVTIPLICMGAFGFAGPTMVQRWGTRRVLASSLVLIAAGTGARAAMPTPALLLVATVPIGIGIALAAVAASIVLKQYFPDRAGTVNGAWGAAMSLGIVAAGLTAVPLADALGSWRDAFAVSALPALLALPIWLTAGVQDHRLEAELKAPRLRPSATGVYLGIMFGLQSLCFGAMVAWGPAVFEGAGWSERDAALAITSIGLFTIIAGLTVVRWSDRGGRRGWLIAMMTVMTVGLVGVAAAPGTLGGLWMVLFGFGSGATMPLCLTIPFDFEAEPSAVGELTGWMLGLGYLLAATGPALVGGLRDLTGGFAAAFGVVVALAVVDTGMAIALPRLRHA